MKVLRENGEIVEVSFEEAKARDYRKLVVVNLIKRGGIE